MKLPQFHFPHSHNELRLLLTVVGVIAIFLLIWFNGAKFGPTSEGTFGNIIVRLKLSDHDASNTLLPNSLTDTATPQYANDNVKPLIRRDAAGNAPTLFRFQGEVDYK